MGVYRHFPYSNFHEMNMDEIIKICKDLVDNFAEIEDDWTNFREYVNNYFANLDVSDEVRANLEEMLNNGEFNAIINTGKANIINAWLESHILPESEVVLDSSLTLANAAAQARATGYLSRNNKNIVNIGDNVDTSFTGLTISSNEDNGTVLCTGTATRNVSPVIYNTEGNPFSYRFLQNVTYVLTGCPEGGSNNTFDLSLRDAVDGTRIYTDFGKGVVFTPSEDQTLYLQMRLVTGNGNGLVFRPQIERGSYKTPFYPRSRLTAYDHILESRMDNIFNLYNNMLTRGGIVNEMLKVAKTYMDNGANLSYGQETATHWYIDEHDYSKQKLYEEYATPTEIDCSTLALLLIMGVPYEASKYAGNRDNIINFAGYSYDIFKGDDEARMNTTGTQSLSYNMARFADENGFGFRVDYNNMINAKPGDILFFSSDNHDEGAWLDIDHVEVYLGQATNLPSDPEQPMIVTINASGSRPSYPVQISNRGKSFYDGTNSVHRRLVYVARFPIGTASNFNTTYYTKPDKSVIVNIPFSFDQYKSVSIVFDGTINTADGHFTAYVNNNGVVVSKNINGSLLGKKIRYKLLVISPNEPCENISIRAIGDANAIIEGVWISEGVAC